MGLGTLLGVALVVGVAFWLLRSRDEVAGVAGAARAAAAAPPTAESVDALIAAGRKIEAIKAWRELHRVGLKEAKEAVEARARTLRLG